MTPIHVIMDGDPGVDDMAAILLALASPELEVQGFCAVGGNVPLAATTRNACKVLSLAGRADIAVYPGCAGPLVRDQIFGKHVAVGAFSDDLVPASTKTASAVHAVDYIVETALHAASISQPITICASGPLTNIGLALVKNRDVARGIARIALMGGAFKELGNRVPWAEYNILADPHAADIVLQSGIDITMLPLDVTFQALMTSGHLAMLRARCGRAGGSLADLFEAFDRSDPARFGRDGGPIHDALVVAWLIAPRLFSSRCAAVGVETGGLTLGHTYADFHGQTGRPANVEVVHSVDADGFFSLFLDRLAHYESVESGSLETAI